MTVLIVVETAILIVLSILVAGLLRSYATVLQRLHQLDGGERPTAAPPFRTVDGVTPPATRPTRSGRPSAEPEWGPGHDISGVGLYGEIISVRTLGTGVDTVLVFLSSGCAGCTGFWDDFAHRRDASIAGTGRILVVTKGPEAESTGLLREICPPGVDLVMSGQAWADYAVPGSPYVVVVDGATGRIRGEGSGTSLTQLSGLVHQSLGDLAAAGHRPPAKPRPDADREVDVDRVLLAAGIAPGDPTLYGGSQPSATPELIGFPGRRPGTDR